MTKIPPERRPPDPLAPHSHDPNPDPPTADPGFTLELPDGAVLTFSPADLEALPRTTLPGCTIVSTGHGTSGPFTFAGPSLRDFLAAHVPAGQPWAQVEVWSADGFGTRVARAELEGERNRPILLAVQLDGAPLTRRQGLVRLIVPSETDDALRQVKWVGRVRVR